VVLLALVFLIIMTMPGFHDNNLKISLIAYIVINLLFSIWILKGNVFIRIFFGILIALLSALASYYIQSFFFSILSDTITAAILFFVIYAGVFIGLWEVTMFLFLRFKNRTIGNK
jgi:hypothetical protein